MTSIAMLNLIVSLVALAILITVMRVAYLIAGDRPQATQATQEPSTPYDLERAA